MPQSVVQRAFIGGELAPGMYARADQAKYLMGLALCRNWIVLRHGGVTKRPGTKYVATTKDSTKAAKLRKFVFEGADQTYLLEFGDAYIRFYFHGAPVVVAGVAAYNGATAYVPGDLVVSGGVNYYCKANTTGNAPPNATFWYPLTGTIYEIPTPYAVADVGRLHVAQSADVLVLTHPSYPPYELQRKGSTNWVLVQLTTAPTINPPSGGLTGTPGAAGAITLKYVVTSVKATTFEESYASAAITVTGAAPTTALPNSLGWTAVAGVVQYNVYLDPTANNGQYGYIGSTTTNSFKDPGYQPDFTVQPPVTTILFNATGDYPGTATYYQQRLWTGRTVNDPEIFNASQVGAYHNFSTSIPLEDDDAISGHLAGNHLNPIAHLVGLRRLLILTDEGEWVVSGDDAGVVRPTSINAVQIGYIGASVNVIPEVIGDSCLYAPALGTALLSLDFDQQSGGFSPTDLSLLASHLFEGYTITEIAYARHPHSVVWAVRSDGTLLGLTYVKDQEVVAWHRHTTGASGVVESIQVLPDSDAGRDVLYAIVKRTINSATVRYVEQLQAVFNEDTDDLEDAIYMDAALTYDGAPSTHFTGLSHLNGQRIAVLADGVVISDGISGTSYTVSGGAMTPDLSVAKSVVQFGIPIADADLQTLDLDVNGSDLRDKRKKVQGLTGIVASSPHGLKAGPDVDHLLAEVAEPWEDATALVTGDVELNMTAGYDTQGRTYLRHDQPLPYTLLGIVPLVAVGG